ncbi:MAG: class I SAM-dependent methyltransferase [Opitutaceae bacterium]
MSPEEERLHGTSAANQMLYFTSMGDWNCPVSNGDEMAAGVRPEEGQLLYGLVRALHPEVILELGTGYGFSTIHLAAGCRDAGQGKVYTVEVVNERQAAAVENLVVAELGPWVCFSKEPPIDRQFDLVLLDAGHTAEEVRLYLEFVAPRLRPHALVLVHDGCWQAHARAAAWATDVNWQRIELPMTSTGGLVILQKGEDR